MKELIGTIPKESGFTAKYREHQGWWRTFVLNEQEGRYWDKKHKKWKQVCNRINDGNIDADKKNFLSKEIADEVQLALSRQKELGSGIMETDRLYNNLLSSQPLAFNFFGFFRANPDVAVAFLKTLRPDITIVEDIVFEYAPESTKDHSAFDIGFVVRSETSRGFLGFECKYTDSFSYKRQKTNVFYGDELDKNYIRYHQIYDNNRNRFPDDYFTYIRNPNFNQLFRNELLAMQMESEYDFVVTGLFCHHENEKTVNAGNEFQMKIGDGKNNFIVLTYENYFEHIQKLDLSWKLRELVMLIWARYCGLKLSKNTIN